MATGKIAECTWQDCQKCVNHYGDKHCTQKDSIKCNLRLDANGDIRCGLFTQVEAVES